ncbi:hypothetical protein RB195_001590 [Necator americanus]|uniref:Uncharacterized protein n=1 Tax=Necator americanus TaxID=51031 RepID=A0ABR1DGF8_NECAM
MIIIHLYQLADGKRRSVYFRMRLLASAGRLLSRSARSCEPGPISSLIQFRPSVGTWQVVKRPTTTGAFHSLDKFVIEDSRTALEIVARLTRDEQSLLREALDDLAARHDLNQQKRKRLPQQPKRKDPNFLLEDSILGI